MPEQDGGRIALSAGCTAAMDGRVSFKPIENFCVEGTRMSGHEQIEELCRCPVCKGTAQGIMLDAAYRLNRYMKPEAAHKLIERINGELEKFAQN